jgi:hypothetical protein
MRFRTTIWMALILLALVTYLFVVEFPLQQKIQETGTLKDNVFNINKEEIYFINIKYPEQEIQLQKINKDRWEIINPLTTETDEREVSSFISTIIDMKLNRLLENPGQKLSDYGLDRPRIEITLTMDGHDEKVIVGDNGPVTNTLYVQRGSDQKIILTDEWIRESLTRTVFDLRNKKILTIDQDNVTELKLEFLNERFIISKVTDQWIIKEPKPSQADYSTINNILITLDNLRATGFIDQKDDKSKIQTQFKSADLIVSIKDDDIDHVIKFYQVDDDDSIFASTTQNLPYYKLSKTVLNSFKTDLFYYQDKHLLKFDQNLIDRIDINTSTESYSLQLINETWSIIGEERKANTEEVNQFLVRLKKLKAQNKPLFPVQHELVGLDPSSIKVRLFDAKGKLTAQLIVGNEIDNMIHAMGSSELGDVLIKKDVLDDIPMKNELMISQIADDAPVSEIPGP